jgi:hypothetical protein
MSSIPAKLDKLDQKITGGRQDAVDGVQAMRKVFKEASMRKSLAKNPAMSKLISIMRKREESITILLANKEEMSELERSNLFSRRKEVKYFLSFFDSADSALASMEKELDYQLSDDVREDVDNDD